MLKRMSIIFIIGLVIAVGASYILSKRSVPAPTVEKPVGAVNPK